jgi:hypothetical protein
MGVDVQVADRADLKVKEAVAGQLIQHVIKEAYAGGNFALSGSVEVDGDGDVGFGRPAGDGCDTHG